MSATNYDTLRELLDRSFSLENLRAAVRMAHGLARSPDVTHPAVPFVIAAVLDGVASRWFEGEAVDDKAAAMLEARIMPSLRLLLDTVQRPLKPAQLLDRMNGAVRAYGRCVVSMCDPPPGGIYSR